MTFKNRITNVNPAPAASGTSTIIVGTGPNAPTLDKLQLTLAAATGTFDCSKITAIRGYIDGRQFYAEGSGTRHNARRDYLGLHTSAGEIVLDFTEPNARTAIEQNLTAIPLSMIQDLRFELDIDPVIGTAPSIVPIAHFRAPTKNPYIKKQLRLTQGFAAGGEQTIYLPNGTKGGKLLRVWLHEGSAGNITAVELRAKNAVGIESSRAQLQDSQRHNKLVPQTGVLVLDFIEDGNLSGWFDTSALADVELRLTGTAADTYTVYMEYADPIARL